MSVHTSQIVSCGYTSQGSKTECVNKQKGVIGVNASQGNKMSQMCTQVVTGNRCVCTQVRCVVYKHKSGMYSRGGSSPQYKYLPEIIYIRKRLLANSNNNNPDKSPFFLKNVNKLDAVYR